MGDLTRPYTCQHQFSSFPFIKLSVLKASVGYFLAQAKQSTKMHEIGGIDIPKCNRCGRIFSTSGDEFQRHVHQCKKMIKDDLSQWNLRRDLLWQFAFINEWK